MQIRSTLRAHDLHAALDEASHACATLQVTQVRLGRGHHQGGRPDGRVVNPLEGANLDGVAQRGARAVALEAIDLLRLEARFSEGGFDALLLRRTVRRRDAGTSAILIRLAAGDEGEDLRRPLLVAHVDRRSALATAVAVCRGVEGEGAALVGQHAATAAADKGPRGVGQVDAGADDGLQRVEVLVLQVELSSVHRHQAGRASRVDGLAGSLQVHGEVATIRQDGVVPSTPGRILGVRDHVPLGAAGADKDAYVRRRTLQGLEVVSTHGECLVHDLEGLALVGVHSHRLTVRDAEELGVEKLDAIHEALVLRIGPRGYHGELHVVDLAVEVGVPARDRRLDKGVATGFGEHEPEAEVVLGVSAQNRGDASDGHAIAFWRPGAIGGAAQQLQVPANLAHLELGPLPQEPRLQGGARALRAGVAVAVALSEEDDHHARGNLNHDVVHGLIFALRDEHQAAREGPQKLHDTDPLPLHQAQERLLLRIRRARRCWELCLLIVVSERLPDHQVRAARHSNAQLLFQTSSHRFAQGSHLPVLRSQRALRDSPGHIRGVKVDQHHLLSGVPAEVVRFKLRGDTAELQLSGDLVHVRHHVFRHDGMRDAITLVHELLHHLVGENPLVASGAKDQLDVSGELVRGQGAEAAGGRHSEGQAVQSQGQP
mmetsp:Transcript_21771/g.70385  ORF Transcript_21771/g.70385 Transcript_21771/m.70385 type:complete len:658 (-) Transcript_21771:261-2234(-)